MWAPKKIYDISRPLSAREPVYPGNAPVRLIRLKTFARDRSTLSALSLGLHTASHLDAPLHYLRRGRPVGRVPLSACMGSARVVAITAEKREIGKEAITKIRPKRGEILLFKTANSRTVRGRRFNKDFTYLTADAARVLVRARVKAVGTDGPSIRKFGLRPDTVHPALLRASIMIYEGLTLFTIKPGNYFFIGLPLKIVNAEASPVRAALLK